MSIRNKFQYFKIDPNLPFSQSEFCSSDDINILRLNMFKIISTTYDYLSLYTRCDGKLFQGYDCLDHCGGEYMYDKEYNCCNKEDIVNMYIILQVKLLFLNGYLFVRIAVEIVLD